MRIYCVGYRSWSIDIYKYFLNNSKHTIRICDKKKKFKIKNVIKFKPDIILFYGWSSKISTKLVSNYFCVMFHPSPLPKFSGGSPIQNQIINNVNQTKITLFRMTNKVDGGPILVDKKVSLKGHINDIFKRFTDIGILLTKKILKGQFIPKQQKKIIAQRYKRRKPSESEITIKELKNKSGKYLYNKIRMLEDPYPNAFIKTKDGKKLLIKMAELKNR